MSVSLLATGSREEASLTDCYIDRLLACVGASSRVVLCCAEPNAAASLVTSPDLVNYLVYWQLVTSIDMAVALGDGPG